MPTWIADLQALLTPVIAILALYVAWQQWETNRYKFRLDYFNRRFPIYEAAMRLAGTIAANGTVTDEELRTFSVKTRETKFFFNDGIERYCRKLHDEARAVMAGTEKLKAALSEQERQKSQELRLQRVGWFNEQVNEIPRKFGKFLQITGWK